MAGLGDDASVVELFLSAAFHTAVTVAMGRVSLPCILANGCG